jgi:hypothetical protein
MTSHRTHKNREDHGERHNADYGRRSCAPRIAANNITNNTATNPPASTADAETCTWHAVATVEPQGSGISVTRYDGVGGGVSVGPDSGGVVGELGVGSVGRSSHGSEKTSIVEVSIRG